MGTFARFCVMQGAYWSFQASVVGYYTAYILEHGMMASVWGIVLALYMFCSFLGSLFWGRWVDRQQASKTYFMIGNASALILGLLLYFLADHLFAVMLLYPVLGFMTGTVPTVLDAWVIASFPERKEAGSKSRSYATLSYAFAMLLTGQAVVRWGYHIMPVAAIVFLSISMITAAQQPNCQRERGEEAENTGGMKGSIRKLLSSHRYCLLVLTLFFTGMAIAPINSMKVVVLESVGGNVGTLGWDSFIGCMIQAQFLIFSRKLLHVRPEKRLFIGVMMPLFYALLVAAAQSPWMIILGTVMNNISFGLLYTTMREMTEETAPSTLRNTAHSVTDTAYGALSGMIATSYSGMIMDSAGAMTLGMVCAGVQIIALCACAVLVFSGSGKSVNRMNKMMPGHLRPVR